MWRPEWVRWGQERNEWLSRNTVLAITIENKAIYEAGAEAMLNAVILALFEKRLKVKRGKGYLALIPDEGGE